MKLEFESNTASMPLVESHDLNAVVSDNNSPEVLQMLRDGIKAAQEGNRAEARQLLLRVTEADSNNENAWLWLASISEYPEELLVFLNNVLNINPDNERAIEWAKATKSLLAKTFVQRGINSAKDNQKDFAKQCFLQAIVHDIESELAWLWLASVSDSLEEKISHLHKVLKINPDNENAQSSMANAKIQLAQALIPDAQQAASEGRLEDAHKILDKALSDAPNLEDAWLLKSQMTDSLSEKMIYFEKVLAANPNNAAAKSGLASLKSLMGVPPAFEKQPAAENLQPQAEDERAEEKLAEDESEAFELKDEENPAELKDEENQVEPEEAEEEELEMTAEDDAGDNAEELNAEENLDEEEAGLELAGEAESDEAQNFDEEVVEYSESEEVPQVELEVSGEESPEVEEKEENVQEFSNADVVEPRSADSAYEFEEEEEEEEEFKPEAVEEQEFAVEAAEPEMDEFSEAENFASEEFAPEQDEFAPEQDEFAPEQAEFAPEQEENFVNQEEQVVVEFEQSEKDQFEVAVESFVAEKEESPVSSFAETQEYSATDFGSSLDNYAEPDNEFTQEKEEEEEDQPEAVFAEEDSEPNMPGFDGLDQAEVSSPNQFDEQSVKLMSCPFCQEANEPQSFVCKACRAILTLSDIEMILGHEKANKEIIKKAIEEMEEEKEVRLFDAEELKQLGIGYINIKDMRKGFEYLQESLQANPEDVVLVSHIDSLAIRLAEIEQQEKDKEEDSVRSANILVVDDSPTVRKLISGKLEKCGHEVICAVDGMDALAKINELIPDLILLDITMPRMDGYQVCKLIRSNEATQNVPVVMISGKDGFFDKVRGKMAGTTNYITKPFGPETLMKAVNEYIN
jgi:twitching motility two-component system response regulator PilG